MTNEELSLKVAELRGDRPWKVYDCFDLLCATVRTEKEAKNACEQPCFSYIYAPKSYSTDMNHAMELVEEMCGRDTDYEIMRRWIEEKQFEFCFTQKCEHFTGVDITPARAICKAYIEWQEMKDED